MNDIDIDAIRQQVPIIWAHWSEIQNTPQPGLVTARLICTQQSADDIPTVLRWVEKLTKKVDELTAALAEARATADVRQGQLQAAREQAATYANEVGSLTAENARVRQQRDAHADVVEAAKAWREQFSKDPITKGPRMAALMNAVDALPKAEVASEDDGPLDYLIWSQHHQSWWGPYRSGYRANPADAGRYTLAAAKTEMTRGCHCCQVPEVPVFAAKVIGKGTEAVRDAISQATDWTVMAGQANKAYEPVTVELPGTDEDEAPQRPVITVELPAEAVAR